MSQTQPKGMVVAPQFEDTKSVDHRYIFTTGVFGGLHQPSDAQIIFYLDRLEPQTASTPQPGSMSLKKILRELQVEIHMTPTMFKSMASWMNKNVEEYEKIFGEIPIEPKAQEERLPPKGMIT